MGFVIKIGQKDGIWFAPKFDTGDSYLTKICEQQLDFSKIGTGPIWSYIVVKLRALDKFLKLMAVDEFDFWLYKMASKECFEESVVNVAAFVFFGLESDQPTAAASKTLVELKRDRVRVVQD